MDNNKEILAALDVVNEYTALGVRVSGRPRASGMVACYAYGREDRSPSAWINIKSGYYGDSGGKGTEAYSCSLWDFAVRVGRFPDWKAARKAYAEKAGVKIGRVGGKPSQTDWREKLEFQAWDVPGNNALAQCWCLRKPGVTVDAVKAAGGRLAYYPCYRDRKTKEIKRTHNCRQVIAFPCYGQWLLDADPVAWQIFDTSAQPFDVTPKDHPLAAGRILAKDISVGPTAGTLCGLSSLMALLDPDQRARIKLVWKVEGIPDMLALWATIPAGQREATVVITQAGGATADVQYHQVKVLAGLAVAVVPDADEAGQVGAEKWCRALYGVADEIRYVRLPFDVLPKNGKDVRDFLTEDLDADLR